MPTPTGTFHHIPKLNVWFALSAIVLMVTTVWFIWVDYDRDWREYQSQYMTNQAAVAHLDYLQTQQASAKARLDESRAAVDAARAAVEARSGDIAALEKDLNDAEEAYQDVKIDYGKADAVLQVTRDEYERTRTEFGDDHSKTQAARAKVDRQIETVDELRRKREDLEDRIRETKRGIAALRRPLVEAEAAYETLAKSVEDTKKRESEYSSRLLRTALNMPLLDFAAPKGTPARQEVRQLVLPDVRQRLNYLESYTVDRCVTCHVAIDDPTLTRKELSRKMEASLPAINEALAEQGLPALTPPPPPELKPDGRGTPPKITAGDVARHWEWLSREQRTDYFEQLLAKVNEYLAATGRKRVELGQPLLGHPDLNLFVGIDSPHPMAKMGCTVCHEGNPAETEFVLASHTPASHEQEEEWKEKHYVTALGVPTATFKLVEHYWDRPMLPLEHTQASCVKCHTDIADLSSYEFEPQARTINLGRDLFTRSGCINCHSVEGLNDYRRVGPDLTQVASKLEPGFTQRWIFNPREFRPSTWMPHLFNQENNGPGSENEYDPTPVLRTETEIMAITKYLFELSRPWEDMEKPPEGIVGDTERGRKLFTEVGCLACHSNLSEFGENWIVQDLRKREGKSDAEAQTAFASMTYNDRVQYAWDHFVTDRQTVFFPEEARFDPDRDYNPPSFTRVGPELSAIGTKTTREWLYAWLRNPHAYHPETRMPSLRLTEQEAADIAEYLFGLKHDQPRVEPFPEDEAHKGMVDQLVMNLLSAQRSEKRSRAIMDDADGELTRLLVEATAGSPMAELAAQRINRLSIDEKRLMYLGNKMISHYGCYACHQIAGFETAARPGTDLTTWAEKPISQLDFAFFYTAFDDLREKHKEVFGNLYPPGREDLVHLNHGENPPEEITHTHASFAYHKMRNPRIWDRQKIKKPYDKLKMPNFYFKEFEAEALVTYLLGRRPPRVNDNLKVDYRDRPEGSIAAGRNLTRELNCVGCHQIEDNAANVHQYYRTRMGGKQYFDEVNAPPHLRGEGAKVQHAWLFGFLQNVENLRPWLKIRMPSFRLTNQEASVLTEYFAGLANDEAGRLHDWLAPVEEYVSRSQGSESVELAKGGNGDPAPARAPGRDWMNQPELEKETDLLARYAVQNRLATIFEIDPAHAEPADRAAGFQKVLSRTSFLRDLFDVPFPFVDAPRPLVSQERFKKGEKLVLELGCLKCHVLGDPTIPGANANPTAPNLNLTFRRLRQDWVLGWLKAPAVIQPGTKMPQLWPDMQSAFSGFGERREECEREFGATGEEQTELVLDFLYNAGLLNHTTIDPNLVQSAPATPGEDEEFTEEEEEFKEEDE